MGHRREAGIDPLDECVGKVADAACEKGGSVIVTVDHGNCEPMIDPPTGGPHTARATYDVKSIIVDDRFVSRSLRTGGRPADSVPAALELMGLAKASDMTGVSLLQFCQGFASCVTRTAQFMG